MRRRTYSRYSARPRRRPQQVAISGNWTLLPHKITLNSGTYKFIRSGPRNRREVLNPIPSSKAKFLAEYPIY